MNHGGRSSYSPYQAGSGDVGGSMAGSYHSWSSSSQYQSPSASYHTPHPQISHYNTYQQQEQQPYQHMWRGHSLQPNKPAEAASSASKSNSYPVNTPTQWTGQNNSWEMAEGNPWKSPHLPTAPPPSVEHPLVHLQRFVTDGKTIKSDGDQVFNGADVTDPLSVSSGNKASESPSLPPTKANLRKGSKVDSLLVTLKGETAAPPEMLKLTPPFLPLASATPFNINSSSPPPPSLTVSIPNHNPGRRKRKLDKPQHRQPSATTTIDYCEIMMNNAILKDVDGLLMPVIKHTSQLSDPLAIHVENNCLYSPKERNHNNSLEIEQLGRTSGRIQERIKHESIISADKTRSGSAEQQNSVNFPGKMKDYTMLGSPNSVKDTSESEIVRIPGRTKRGTGSQETPKAQDKSKVKNSETNKVTETTKSSDKVKDKTTESTKQCKSKPVESEEAIRKAKPINGDNSIIVESASVRTKRLPLRFQDSEMIQIKSTRTKISVTEELTVCLNRLTTTETEQPSPRGSKRKSILEEQVAISTSRNTKLSDVPSPRSVRNKPPVLVERARTRSLTVGDHPPISPVDCDIKESRERPSSVNSNSAATTSTVPATNNIEDNAVHERSSSRLRRRTSSGIHSMYQTSIDIIKSYKNVDMELSNVFQDVNLDSSPPKKRKTQSDLRNIRKQRVCRVSNERLETNSDQQKTESDILKTNIDTQKIRTDTQTTNTDILKINTDASKTRTDTQKMRTDIQKTNTDILKPNTDILKPNTDTQKTILDIQKTFTDILKTNTDTPKRRIEKTKTLTQKTRTDVLKIITDTPKPNINAPNTNTDTMKTNTVMLKTKTNKPKIVTDKQKIVAGKQNLKTSKRKTNLVKRKTDLDKEETETEVQEDEEGRTEINTKKKKVTFAKQNKDLQLRSKRKGKESAKEVKEVIKTEELEKKVSGQKKKGKLKKNEITSAQTTIKKVISNVKESASNTQKEPLWKGPYLSVTPSSTRVVNSANGGCKLSVTNETDSRYKIKKKVVFTSTLSSKYDATTIDPTWICSYCQLRTHQQQLGDLFGPYFIEKPPEVVKETHRRTRLSIGECSKQVPVVDPDSNQWEVWIHLDCAVWTPRVFLVGPKIIGLKESLWVAKHTLCFGCGKMGASIGCVRQTCHQQSHYPCASNGGWDLNQDTFQALCPEHTADKAR